MRSRVLVLALLPFWIFLWMVGWCMVWFSAVADKPDMKRESKFEPGADDGVKMGVLFREEEETIKA